MTLINKLMGLFGDQKLQMVTFFYSVDMDSERRVRSIVWSHAVMPSPGPIMSALGMRSPLILLT
jgi:hypothetical protein